MVTKLKNSNSDTNKQFLTKVESLKQLDTLTSKEIYSGQPFDILQSFSKTNFFY